MWFRNELSSLAEVSLYLFRAIQEHEVPYERMDLGSLTWGTWHVTGWFGDLVIRWRPTAMKLLGVVMVIKSGWCLCWVVYEARIYGSTCVKKEDGMPKYERKKLAWVVKRKGDLMFLWPCIMNWPYKNTNVSNEYYLFVKYYYSPLHVSSIKYSSSGGHSCT